MFGEGLRGAPEGLWSSHCPRVVGFWSTEYPLLSYDRSEDQGGEVVAGQKSYTEHSCGQDMLTPPIPNVLLPIQQ